mmetsp:Transcript_18155/g.25844  ORF Transcript_18155/g.25844 Transcript_18155/m.25844 type:complete len:161 (+) Transcript_18155:173-655(+)
MRSPIGRKPRDVDCESSADHNCSSMRFYPGQPYIALPSVNSNDDEFDAYLKKATPILSKITFGSLVGYCSGAAAKKIGKALAVMVGMGFIAIQGFVYTGYVSIDWKKVQNDAIKAIDTTGDGKVTTDDVKVYWKKLKALLTNGIPSASGFTMGFLYGLAG